MNWLWDTEKSVKAFFPESYSMQFEIQNEENQTGACPELSIQEICTYYH